MESINRIISLDRNGNGCEEADVVCYEQIARIPTNGEVEGCSINGAKIYELSLLSNKRMIIFEGVDIASGSPSYFVLNYPITSLQDINLDCNVTYINVIDDTIMCDNMDNYIYYKGDEKYIGTKKVITDANSKHS